MGIDDDDPRQDMGISAAEDSTWRQTTRSIGDCVFLLRLAQVPAAVRLAAHPLEPACNRLGAGDLASAWLDLITNCIGDPNKGLRNARGCLRLSAGLETLNSCLRSSLLAGAVPSSRNSDLEALRQLQTPVKKDRRGASCSWHSGFRRHGWHSEVR